MALHENPYLISIAYALAFLPWTIINTTDYLSVSWKSVRETRFMGILNLIIAISPIPYLIYYMHLQMRGKQYTEFCAGLVALIFAWAHGIKTAWGLWQLNTFKQWVIKSVNALEKMDIEYKLNNMDYKEPMTAEKISESILVNDMVVDNQIFQGRTLCFLKYGEIEFHYIRNSHIQNYRDLNPVLISLSLLFRNLFILLFTLIDVFKSILISTLKFIFFRADYREIHDCVFGRFRLRPYKPVNVWLVWSTVFAAQGLSKYLENRKNKNERSRVVASSAHSFVMKEQMFSIELLSSGILQLLPELIGDNLTSNNIYTVPFLYDATTENANCKEMRNGLSFKFELLKMATRSGSSLPFECPHVYKKYPISINILIQFYHYLSQLLTTVFSVGASNISSNPERLENYPTENEKLAKDIENNLGYTRFQPLLNNIISDLPVLDDDNFYHHMQEVWDTNAADELNILLFLGTVANNSVEREGHIAMSGERINIDALGDINFPCSTPHMTDSVKEAGEFSQAYWNIHEQLGFFEDEYLREKKSPLFTSCMFPYRWDTFQSKYNRHVLILGEIIDIWNSLSAGSHVKFLLNEISPHWDVWCTGTFKKEDDSKIGKPISSVLKGH